MSIVYINTVWFDDLFELVNKALSCGLDAENVVNFDHIVADCFLAVDLRMN